MKKSEIKLFCLSVFAILVGVASLSAKEYENLMCDESSAIISEEALPTTAGTMAYEVILVNGHLEVVQRPVTATLVGGDCYERRRVWVWSRWRFKRVWKTVRVTCPQAAGARDKKGPGTTVPPHRT